MYIANLKPGTKLMWDCPPYIYPALITEKHFRNPWVKVLTSNNAQWMGPESENLRTPTDEELKQLTWPKTEYLSY